MTNINPNPLTTCKNRRSVIEIPAVLMLFNIKYLPQKQVQTCHLMRTPPAKRLLLVFQFDLNFKKQSTTFRDQSPQIASKTGVISWKNTFKRLVFPANDKVMRIILVQIIFKEEFRFKYSHPHNWSHLGSASIPPTPVLEASARFIDYHRFITHIFFTTWRILIGRPTLGHTGWEGRCFFQVLERLIWSWLRLWMWCKVCKIGPNWCTAVFGLPQEREGWRFMGWWQLCKFMADHKPLRFMFEAQLRRMVETILKC